MQLNDPDTGETYYYNQVEGLLRATGFSGQEHPEITEMNRIRLVLSDMNNRIFGPSLAAIHKILFSVTSGPQQTHSSRTDRH
jgi:hypothetical protein